MIPRMTALIALLAVLLSGPACRAESLGDVPQVVDAGADKPVIAPPSQPPDPPLAPDKNGRAAAAEVENQRRFNELRRELLDDRREFLDARAKNVDQWLAAIAVGLTAIGVVAPIVAFIIGLLGFQRFRDIETEGRQHVAESKEYAKELLEEITAIRDEARARLEETDAKAVSENPTEATRTAERVQRDPAASRIERELAAAVLLQQQEKIEEAIEKWRSVATLAGEENRPLQARAWFSIGHLRSVGEGADLEAAVDAYTKAIELNPALAEAYNNRGNAKADLGQHEAALADHDRTIELNPTLATAYYNRGNTKRSLGQYDAELADYDRAIELAPTFAAAYNNRGYAKHALGQHDAALADLDRAIELAPTVAATYDSRGETKHALGQHDAALADLDRAIELAPTVAATYNNRGNTKESLGRITEAREDYQEALALAQEAGDEEVVTKAQDNLSRLDNNEASGPQGQ